MAQRVEAPSVTVLAGTVATAPATTEFDFQDGIVRIIEVVVPPGPSGLVGFRIARSGQAVIPRTAGQWIITDDERISWDVDGYGTSNAWSVIAYNTDAFDHILYFRFHLDELGSDRLIVIQPLDIVQPAMPQVVSE